ncbi:malectin domain-containing carbohydrate-binding protein [Granulicella sp. S190]|uniref:malectin domain-containing carbohydrate-binding protein n=1 Tax=Granulicella sp. S190 TaxID=1747226 RepID=UPI00131E38CD|nr:malectin domain-containing carbohydrate-binding protein [Granulicella sp. S190]
MNTMSDADVSTLALQRRRLMLAFSVAATLGTIGLPHAMVAQQFPTTTFLPMPAPAVLRMHAGGAASGLWAAETGLNGSGSSPVSTGNAITTTLDPFPAPQTIYQTARSGVFTYTISSLTPGATYPVKLHFAEIQDTAAGQREFNVALNGVQVLSNFDIFAAAGGEFMAVERAFTTTASSGGTIAIQFGSGAAGSPLVSGVEILPPLSSGTTLNTGVYTVISKATSLSLDNNDSVISGTNVIQYTGSVGNTGQQWQINKLPDGTYDLVNLSGGLALDSNNVTTPGAAAAELTSAPAVPTLNQHWRITPQTGGGYTVSGAANGLYLDSGSSASNGALITQNSISQVTSQIWTIAPVQIGASTPFVTYEGEWGTLQNGATVTSQLVPQATQFVTEAIEASGRAYAHLAGASSSVQWQNQTGKAITAVNIRYSIPDASTGGGIDATLNLYVNGQLRQAVPMNSHQTWTYETASDYFGAIETPAAGESAFMYWDEVHVFISGAAVQPGDSIALEVDTQKNTAAYYDIDSIDLEAPPAPLSQPANSVSITDYGAVANDSTHDYSSQIQNAINYASANGQIVWIPQGTFHIVNQLLVNNVIMQGAGAWYSVLYWDTLDYPDLPGASVPSTDQITGESSTLENFAMDSNSNREVHKYGVNLHGANWKIDSLWVQHAGPSLWLQGTGGLVQNMRINNSFADGINLNNGNGDAAQGTNVGNNLTARNNFVRGTGDDGVAINSVAVGGTGASFVQMQNPTVIQNTSVAPWWANCFGVYGAANIYFANNFGSGGSRQNGIDGGPFYSIGQPFQSGKIQGNILFQSGGRHGSITPNPAITGGAGGNWGWNKTLVTNQIIRGNSIVNATFDGLQVVAMENGQIDNNTINSPGMNGINIQSGAQGNAVFNNNQVWNVQSGYSPFIDSASSTFNATGSGNTNFTPQ